jgi:hypothetical protein
MLRGDFEKSFGKAFSKGEPFPRIFLKILGS